MVGYKQVRSTAFTKYPIIVCRGITVGSEEDKIGQPIGCETPTNLFLDILQRYAVRRRRTGR